jgi:DNA-directed RNA polymerase subunit RPC12/RpoP
VSIDRPLSGVEAEIAAVVPLVVRHSARMPGVDFAELLAFAATVHREALKPAAPTCAHRLVDARNEVIKSGYLCLDCGAVFAAADHDERRTRATEQQLRYARNAFERIADGREPDAPKFAKVALAHIFGPTPTPMDASVMKRITTPLEPSTPAAECWCEKCRPNTIGYMRMIVCPECGNKRCPKATNHENACTGSNEVGQKGSSWEHVKSAGAPPAQREAIIRRAVGAWNRAWPAQLESGVMFYEGERITRAEFERWAQ